MAVTVESCKLVIPPNGPKVAGEPITYKGMWHVQTNVPVPGPLALQRAQDITLADPVPSLYDPLVYNYTFTTEGGNEEVDYQDPNSLALEFDPQPVDNTPAYNFANDWYIWVTWRRRTTNERDGNMPPWERVPYFSWTWINHVFEQRKGWRMTGDGIFEDGNSGESSFRTMQNSAQQPFPPVAVEDRYPVANIRRASQTPSVVFDVNNEYIRSVNSESFNFLGRSIQKHYGKFIGAETGEVQIWQGVEYYWINIQIAVGREPWYERRLDEGGVEIVDGNAKHRADTSGVTYFPPYPLNGSGQAAVDPNTGVFDPNLFNFRDYLLYRERDYGPLLGD